MHKNLDVSCVVCVFSLERQSPDWRQTHRQPGDWRSRRGSAIGVQMMGLQMLSGLLLATAFSLFGWVQACGQEPEPTPASPDHPRPVSVARLANVEEVRKQLGLAPAYANLAVVENMKVAVLDYGFDGIAGTRRYLPEDTVVVEHYDP